jgi:hypothetical protein
MGLVDPDQSGIVAPRGNPTESLDVVLAKLGGEILHLLVPPGRRRPRGCRGPQQDRSCLVMGGGIIQMADLDRLPQLRPRYRYLLHIRLAQRCCALLSRQKMGELGAWLTVYLSRSRQTDTAISARTSFIERRHTPVRGHKLHPAVHGARPDDTTVQVPDAP